MANPVIISSYEYQHRLQIQDKDQTIKLRSFIPSLDIALDGFEVGELIVLSGPTKSGKSLFFQTLTNNFITESQIYSLWFTYELPPRQLFNRFPALPLFYLPEELQGHSLSWIGECIKAAKEKVECKAVFIDHLHYLLDLGRMKNTSLEIGAVIRGLKQLAIKYQVVIFLACHMKKTPNDREPNYDDIRDSSFVAQESDVTMMLWRCKEKNEYTNTAKLKIETSRRTGIFGKKIPLEKKEGLLYERIIASPISTV